jgi:hypothetical protein
MQYCQGEIVVTRYAVYTTFSAVEHDSWLDVSGSLSYPADHELVDMC